MTCQIADLFTFLAGVFAGWITLLIFVVLLGSFENWRNRTPR